MFGIDVTRERQRFANGQKQIELARKAAVVQTEDDLGVGHSRGHEYAQAGLRLGHPDPFRASVAEIIKEFVDERFGESYASSSDTEM